MCVKPLARVESEPIGYISTSSIRRIHSVRFRTLLIVLGAMALLLMACYIPLQQTQLRSVLKLEQQTVVTDVERAKQGVDSTLQRMSTLVFAYSAWDDTYHYVSRPTQYYSDENFNPAWMRQSDINIVMIVDQSRRTVYSAYQDLATGRFLPLPGDFLQYIQHEQALTTFTAPENEQRGLLNLRQGPLLYAARPITFSDGSGEPAGTILFGRFLDDASMAKMHELTRFPFTVERLGEQTRFHNGEPLLPDVLHRDLAMPYSETNIEGVGVLCDLVGEPSLMLRVDRPRDLYRESRAGIQNVMIAFLAAGGLASILMTFLIDRMMLARIVRLSANVRDIGVQGNLAARIRVDGRDELATLATDINQMLSALERAEHQHLAAERKHRAVLEQINSDLQANLAERQRMERLKSEFVAIVSHELRTPLTAIRGALGLINGGVGGELPDKAQSMLAMAQANSERLVRLINDILDMEKIEAGRTTFRLQPQSLLPLVHQAIAENRCYADQYHVSLETIVLQDVRAVVDSDRMLQVLANLVSNAAKFSPSESTITVTLGCDGENAVITVRDCGLGIPTAFQDRMFERFAQADSSDSRQKGGTGLGLAITKALVEGMHGSISFTSSSQGTTFYISFPLIN